VYGLTLQSVLLNIRPFRFVQYCVAPAKQLDVGNYVIALLCAVRLALSKSERSVKRKLSALFKYRPQKLFNTALLLQSSST
jgi:hypothetical protein